MPDRGRSSNDPGRASAGLHHQRAIEDRTGGGRGGRGRPARREAGRSAEESNDPGRGATAVGRMSRWTGHWKHMPTAMETLGTRTADEARLVRGRAFEVLR